MQELNMVEVDEVSGAIALGWFPSALLGGLVYDSVKVLIKCERSWDSGDYGYGTYNQLMGRCMSTGSNWGI